jgi:hypothetical protein
MPSRVRVSDQSEKPSQADKLVVCLRVRVFFHQQTEIISICPTWDEGRNDESITCGRDCSRRMCREMKKQRHDTPETTMQTDLISAALGSNPTDVIQAEDHC